MIKSDKKNDRSWNGNPWNEKVRENCTENVRQQESDGEE